MIELSRACLYSAGSGGPSTFDIDFVKEQILSVSKLWQANLGHELAFFLENSSRDYYYSNTLHEN